MLLIKIMIHENIYFCHELTDVFSVCSHTREEKCDSMLLNRNSATVHV